MKLLHTEEEIKYFDALQSIQHDLRELGLKYGNKEVIELADKFKREINTELDKYNSYIGIKCKAPGSYKTPDVYRPGKIEGYFYFNYYSKSVRCNFRYDSGGFDSHAIKELV